MRTLLALLLPTPALAVGIQSDFFQDLPQSAQPIDLGDVYISTNTGTAYRTTDSLQSVYAVDVSQWVLAVDSSDHTIVIDPPGDKIILYDLLVDTTSATSLNGDPAHWIIVDNGSESGFFPMSGTLGRVLLPLPAAESITVYGDGIFALAEATYESDPDVDGDGFLPGEGDCDPMNDTRFPGAYDLPGDGVDADCNGRDERAPFEAMVTMPSCPAAGRLSMGWRGAAQHANIQAVPTLQPAPWVPDMVLPRAGLQCDLSLLGTPVALPPEFLSSQAGTGQIDLNLPAAACGAWVQLVDLVDCTVSKPYRVK